MRPRGLAIAAAAALTVACFACDGSNAAGFRGVPVFPGFVPLERPASDLDPLSRDGLESAALHRDVDSGGSAPPLLSPAWQQCLDLTADVVSDQQKLDEQAAPWRRLVFQEASLGDTQFYSVATGSDGVRAFYERELLKAGWKIEETFVRSALFREVWAVGMSRDAGRVRGFVAFERDPAAASGCGLIAVTETPD